MQFADVVRSRRMTRSFSSRSVDSHIIDECVNLGARAPSAGKSQGWHLVLLNGSDTSRYWDISLPSDKRSTFSFPGLLKAPHVAIVLADPHAYLSRYSEDDKKSTGLGNSLESWVAPYWTIDASFATMTFLLALEDNGLGSLFFAHSHEDEIRDEFSIPSHVVVLGVIAFGYAENDIRKGRSSAREQRTHKSIVHQSNW